MNQNFAHLANLIVGRNDAPAPREEAEQDNRLVQMWRNHLAIARNAPEVKGSGRP